MDIYTILSTRPHNPHYLNRYIRFIRGCQQKNLNFEGYTEKHHICPKADDMFPEYKNLNINPWNKVILTPRQHFIAHLILCKVYKNNKSVWYTINMMMNFSYYTNKSRLYQYLRETHSKNLSKNYKNTRVIKNNEGIFKRIPIADDSEIIGTSKNYIWINNNIEEKTVDPSLDIPDGWEIGRTKKETRFYITNGSENRRIKVTDKIPEGWVKGYTKLKPNKGIKNKPKTSATYNHIWINNGITSKFLNKNENIPEGWVKGRLPWK